MTTTTTWSQPSGQFKPLCVNDLRVEAIPNSIQLDNCNTCVTPQIPAGEGGCFPCRDIPRTVKIHLPFALQEMNPTGVTTQTTSRTLRVVSTHDDGEVNPVFTFTQTWHHAPVPGGTAFSLIIPPNSRSCRRYWIDSTATYGVGRPKTFNLPGRTERWIRRPPATPYQDSCIGIPELPAAHEGEYQEDTVPVTNSQNTEYIWSFAGNPAPFTEWDPVTGALVQSQIFPQVSNPNPHPDFTALDTAVGLTGQNSFLKGFTGWAWQLSITSPSVYHSAFHLRLYGQTFLRRTATASAAIAIGSSPVVALGARPETFPWIGNHITPLSYPNGSTRYMPWPTSLLTRPEGAVAYPPGVLYRFSNGAVGFGPVFPDPRNEGIAQITQPFPFLVGEWGNRIVCGDPMPAPLYGGFVSGTASRTAGPVTLPSTIYLDIGTAP